MGMKLQAGRIVSLRVDREVSPYGYFLSSGDGGDTGDVLLHYSELTGEINIGDVLEVFLFHDTHDRLAATMKRPYILLGEIKLLEVVDTHPKLGCFLDIGLGRNLLLPRSELPEGDEFKPVAGDFIYVKMEHDRQGRMLAKTATERELAAFTFHAPTDWKNQWLECRAYKPLRMGTFVVVQGGVLGFGAFGFIHDSEQTKPLRLGEAVTARVTHVRDDGRVNLSMRPLKETGRLEDADRILDFLRQRPNGAMPYSDETPADIIQEKFNISKSAFKRALGKLMKDGLIYQEDGWTYLKENKERSPEETT